MLSVVFRALFLPVVRDRLEELSFEEPEGAVVGFAESPAGLGNFVEDRLEARAAGDLAEHAADRALLLAHVCKLTGELRFVGNRGFDLRSLRRSALPG
jgi:hypothetical protein